MANVQAEAVPQLRSASDPDPEVPPKARRRRFTASYKQRILEEVDRCSQPGEIGALLRREGLYSSLVSSWRQQREAGALEALEPKKRGRKPRPVDPQARRVAELERENARLRKKLDNAETIIEVQKNYPGLKRPTCGLETCFGVVSAVPTGGAAEDFLAPRSP